jgi:acyl transferase domain-containing protein
MSASLEEYRQRLREALQQIQFMETELEDLTATRTEPIAVIGAGCRFPGGANSPEEYYRLLVNGFDAIGEVPPERWGRALISSSSGSGAERAARWGAFLNDIDAFDAQFFGISPREARLLDPQQRILLEVAWEALERAGQPPDRLTGSPTGVFIGLSTNDYMSLGSQRDPNEFELYDITGNGHCFPAGRLSYVFGFQGPCLAVDTACSSSLVATHLACQSLRLRECDMALVGGAQLMISPMLMAMLTKSQGLSPDGRCKTFDARANGFVRGEGIGVVILKRLSDAQRDGDSIAALIIGSSLNQDGSSAGFTAPNGKAQEQLLQRALADARVTPDAIEYIETHGTGTSLGDPIEAEALKAIFGDARADDSRCMLGALKTNVGHLEAASGIASIIKMLGVFQNSMIPKNLHFRALNPRISFDGTPLTIPTENRAWKRGAKLRRAGVSAFGMSGTNAHVIFEEPPVEAEAAPETSASAYLLPLSAKTPDALLSLVRSYAEWFSKENGANLQDVVYTASMRRTHHEHRLAVVANTREEFEHAFASVLASEAPGIINRTLGNAAQFHKIVFVFPGQGSQWFGMSRQLLAEEPAFRTSIEACDAIIQQEAGFSILDQLRANEAQSRMSEIEVIQPLLFSIGVALAALWRSWGIEPDCVVGHSMGEVAAAHVAGMVSLHDAVKVICLRSRLLKRISGQGMMALVELPMAEAERVIANYESKLGIAASNGPRATVLSGDRDALETVLAALEKRGVFCRRVKVDVASHSPQVDPLHHELLAGPCVTCIRHLATCQCDLP